MSDGKNLLNGDTLKIIKLIKDEVKPVHDDVKELSSNINENVIPVLENHEIYIQHNRSDIDELDARPAKTMQFIFWVAIILLQFIAIFVSIFKEHIIKLFN